MLGLDGYKIGLGLGELGYVVGEDYNCFEVEVVDKMILEKENNTTNNFYETQFLEKGVIFDRYFLDLEFLKYHNGPLQKL